MAKSELETVLDFILNKAQAAEFEVIVKACERRRKDMGRYADLGGLNPGQMAQRMASSVQAGIDSNVAGLKGSVRDYVARIIRQKEPGVTDEQIDQLVDMCLPDRSDPEASASGGQGADLPPEALALMVRDFTDYSLGVMPPHKQQELWEQMPRWQDMYWQSFSPELRAFVKARLDGKLADDEFWSTVFSLLGL